MNISESDGRQWRTHLQGERRQEQKEENERFHRVERFYGSFSRSFHLPEDADAAGLKASGVQVPVE